MHTLYGADCFENVTATMDDLNLHKLFAMENSYNQELAKQLYVTLYISGERNDTSTWMLELMIQGKDFHLTAGQFLEIVDLPRYEADLPKLHILQAMTDGEFSTLLDPAVTGDAMSCIIMPKHLVFLAKTWFYILAKTILPQGGISDETPISSVMRHAITHLAHRCHLISKTASLESLLKLPRTRCFEAICSLVEASL